MTSDFLWLLAFLATFLIVPSLGWLLSRTTRGERRRLEAARAARADEALHAARRGLACSGETPGSNPMYAHEPDLTPEELRSLRPSKKERRQEREVAQRAAAQAAERTLKNSESERKAWRFGCLAALLVLVTWYLWPSNDSPVDYLHSCQTTKGEVPCLEAGMVVVPDGNAGLARITPQEWSETMYDPSIRIP